ncbi:MAG TPA: ABC transporter ATP-binding protein [Saprospiraceae bacterium]|nr:ABC transporter ATP-binding protein [Saprospiraceae bacterium]HPN69538.1 ABC transporter ATP-binding protein [Saprospiraceae bacterium]
MSILSINNVSKWFENANGRTEVLKDINLEIAEGEFVAIVGFTGSGKSTLINMIAGLTSPSAGEILLKGKPITGPGHDRSVIFQNYSLLPWLTVYENIMMAVNEVYPTWDNHQKDQHVLSMIEMVNLSHAKSKLPKELSGGMRQRTSVARALSMNPDLLLMDEPLGALDALTRGNLQEEILNIWSKDKKTALLITNDVDEGIFMADRIIPLNPGPNATLGPEFVIDIERPRDKTSLNDNDAYKKLRNGLIEYLMDLGAQNKSGHKEELLLPDIQPNPPKRKFFFRRA